MSTVAELIVRIGADISSLSSGFTAVSKELDRMAAGFKKTAANFEKIGIAMAAAGGAIAAGLGSAVKTAADFEEQISGVGSQVGQSGAELDKFRQLAMDMGSSTKFSAMDAAKGISELIKAGVDVSDVMGGGLAGALALAAAGDIEVAEAADVASKALNIFKLKGDQTAHVADLLAAAANKSATDVHQMGQSFSQGAGQAAGLGVSIEETTGTLALFAQNALVGSDGGTAFKTMLSHLNPSSKEAAAAIKEMRLEFFDLDGNFKGVAAAAEELHTKLAGMTQQQRESTLMTIFGSDAIRAARVLYNEGAAGVNEWTAKVNDAGYAAQTAALRQDNLKGSLELLGGAFETAQIAIGTALTPAIRAIADALAVLVNQFNALPTSMQESIASTAAVAAGVLLLGAAVAMLIAYWPAVLGGLSAIAGAFAAITSPIGMLIVGFGALVAAFGYWIATNQQAYATFSAVWTSITNFFQQAIDLIGTIWDTFFSDYGARWASWGGDLVADAKAFLLAIAHAFEWGLNLASDTMALVSAVLRGDWKTALDALAAMSVDFQMLTGTTFEELKNSVGAIWQDFKDMLVLIWEGAMTALGVAFNLLWQDLKNTASGIADTIVSAFKGAINMVINAINALIGVWNSLQFNVPLIDMGPLGQWGGYSVGVPTIAPIPALADGGVISSAGAALVGERGPELLNLPRGASVTPLPAMAGGGGGATYNTYITVQGSVVGEAEIWRIARKGGIAHRRSNLAGDLS